MVLHRVAADQAGEIDTVRVDARGGFMFKLPTVPDPGGRGEVYFASVRHQGILYFGPAVHQAVQLDSLYRVEVHDTTVVPSGGADLRLDIRYVVAEPAEGSGWMITDLQQVTHGGDRTLVPGPESRPVWSYPLPPQIRDFEVGSSDLPPEATQLVEGRLQVTAPVPPGQRQFVVRYRVDDLDLTLPTPGVTGQMEFLVQEPAPPVEVAGLQPAEALDMGAGPAYRRFTGAELSLPSITVTAGEAEGELPIRWYAAGLALILAAAGAWVVLRDTTAGRPTPAGTAAGSPSSPGDRRPTRSDPGVRSDPRSTRDTLVLEIARIDEELESGSPDEAAAHHLRERRTRLIRRLQSLG